MQYNFIAFLSVFKTILFEILLIFLVFASDHIALHRLKLPRIGATPHPLQPLPWSTLQRLSASAHGLQPLGERLKTAPGGVTPQNKFANKKDLFGN